MGTMLGMLQMLAVFLITFFSIGLPHSFSGALAYVLLMMLSSCVAVNLATRNGTHFVGCAGAALFLVFIGSWLVALASVLVGFLAGEYVICTMLGTTVICLGALFNCATLEPSAEELENMKANREFAKNIDREIKETVMALITAHPELDPEKFGVEDRFSPLDLFVAWDFMRMAASSTAHLLLEVEAEKMEILESYELSIIHDNGVHLIPAETVIREVRYSFAESMISMKQVSDDDCKRILDWIRAAIRTKKELGDLSQRLEDDLLLWK